MTPPRRPAATWRPVGAALMAAFLLLASAFADAQQISYTVQVVALSDRDSAIDIQTDLLRQGFPAYVVRSTSSQGDVFRVRVGAFANRQAALLYAEAMPHVAGGQPVPALAESIPHGVTPLAPRLVLEQDLTGVDARLLRIGGKLALRTQQRSPLAPAEYVILSGGAAERLRAWQVSVNDAGDRTVVRDMALWPATWQDETAEVLEGYQTSLIALVAKRLELDPATVRAARYGLTAGAPRLIVVERTSAGALDGAELLALGLPVSGMTPAGPLQYLGIDPDALPGVPDGVRLDLAEGTATGELSAPADGDPADGVPVDEEPAEDAPADDETAADEPANEEPADEEPADEEPADEEPADEEPADEEPAAAEAPGAEITASGDRSGAAFDWRAEPDGPYVRLMVPPVAGASDATSWRAALGTPLWSGEGYLVAHVGTTLLIYDFLPRD